jgi:hypothetical protein
MMSSNVCFQQADMCETRGVECADSELRTGWLEMARHWRELAGDKDAQATTARLMQGRRIAG